MPDSKQASASDDSEMAAPGMLGRVFTGVVTHNSQIDPPGDCITESNFHDEALVALIVLAQYTTHSISRCVRNN
eukprot:293920-Prorocentrum_minimum.AAC.1